MVARCNAPCVCVCVCVCMYIYRYSVWSFIMLTWMFTFVLSCDAVSATECIIYVAATQVRYTDTHRLYCSWSHIHLHMKVPYIQTFKNVNSKKKMWRPVNCACITWSKIFTPIPLTERSKAARFLGLRVRIPLKAMDVCLLWVLCVVAGRERTLRGADHKYRGVLLSASVSLSVIKATKALYTSHGQKEIGLSKKKEIRKRSHLISSFYGAPVI